MKMKFAVAAALMMVSVPGIALAQAAYNVETTDLGTMLDDPAAKAVLEKNLPGFTTNSQIDMARSMTLKGIQQYMSDTLTDEKLKVIQGELSKLPAKK